MMGSGRQTRVLVACAAVGTGCSLLTPTDGLSGGAAPDAADAGTTSGDATVDAPADAFVGPSAPRAWRRLEVPGPSARHSGAMVYARHRSRIVMFGGEALGETGDTYEWDGAAWSRSKVFLSPPPRKGLGLAYDTVRSTVVATPAPSGVWQWDGGPSWTNVRAIGGPRAAYACPATFHGATGNVLVFGGLASDGKTDLAETWLYAPETGFQLASTQHAPEARHGHVLVYDARRGRTVLFGGSGESSGLLGDTWEYDGADWSPRSPLTGPVPRVSACAAFDAARGVVVMFGGRTTQRLQSLAETWEWDGVTWKLGPSGPPGRRSCMMAYDEARSQIVMYGGSFGRPPEGAQSTAETWVYE